MIGMLLGRIVGMFFTYLHMLNVSTSVLKSLHIIAHSPANCASRTFCRTTLMQINAKKRVWFEIMVVEVLFWLEDNVLWFFGRESNCL